MCAAFAYRAFGFAGELIVKPEWRGHGYGRRLLEHALDHLRAAGIRQVFLDGVPAAVPLYERMGFRRVCRSLRFAGYLLATPCPRSRAMGLADLPAVADMDRTAFGANRRYFLKRRLALYPELCFVLPGPAGLDGFIMGRRGEGTVAAGPWIVHRDALDAGELLRSLAPALDGAQLAVGCLESNRSAVDLLRALGLRERTDAPWRMVLGSPELPGNPDMVFAIGSAAKG
jgi:ribosomal protein S18 acetylase RimI-like enzyme